ncbi:MAG: ornithine decarboxylase [Moraxellaceae bacterium]|nr:MAG: ornithine decarboxylase [Moraxellaceae bacterium]
MSYHGNFFDIESQRLTLWSILSSGSSGAVEVTKPTIDAMQELMQIERFWAYPGFEVMGQLQNYVNAHQPSLFHQLAKNTYDVLINDRHRKQAFKPFKTNLMQLDRPNVPHSNELVAKDRRKGSNKTYFEVLIVHPSPMDYELLYRNSLATFKTERDEFVYDILFVGNTADAITACLANPSIQACVHVPGYVCDNPKKNGSAGNDSFLHTSGIILDDIAEDPLFGLTRALKVIRPELNHYLISELPPAELFPETRTLFDRVFFHIDPFQDIHLALLSGIRERYITPFFDALRAYSRKPKGVFHALPLSRGTSIKDSHWITDMLDFYGPNIFLAETSSTQGGMDSLLDPRGAIKQAHDKAALAFGSMETFFVTNGTSTSNKIVMQSNLQPGDIVLISADCHKSIPYSIMLSGAFPIFLETYPLREYDLYGAVSLSRIKQVLLDLKKQGNLHRVKQITLTNSTFDGLIYNTQRFMMNILAIKPDIIFHWDEAWFAFSYFCPLYVGRTAMSVAAQLTQTFQSKSYDERYEAWCKEFPEREDLSDKSCLTSELMPDPKKVKLRVYSTHSTHKTLTTFRQGSMLHVYDTLFNRDLFLEAYRMHTSTSPNYQIIASLDVARRQGSLEGYERVKRSIRLALILRDKISSLAILAPFFRVLNDDDLIPKASQSNSELAPECYQYADIGRLWGNAEFVVDPTRITLDVSGTGMDGSNFREMLINKYDIQVNKTSRKTVLFIVNIGADEATINYLIDVLCEIAGRLTTSKNRVPMTVLEDSVEQIIDLPQNRQFHPSFTPYSSEVFSCIDMRSAYYGAFNDKNIRFVPLNNETIKDVMNEKKLVSASFITPYPPGFPVVVPGQLITHDILLYLQKMKIKEIHGYQSDLGLKIFTEDYLSSL